jgi:2-oxoglutarate dehydrogenase complex dehydrogenase (E1) component-like enzyme
MRGHKLAQLDPLGLSSADLDSERPNDLTFKFYNFSKNSKSGNKYNISS